MSFEDLKVRTLVDLDVDPLFTLPNPPPPFVGCDSLGFVVGFVDNVNFVITDDSIVFDGAGNPLPNNGIACAMTTTTPIHLGANKLWFEHTITAADDGVASGTCINLFFKDDIDGAAIQPNFGGVAKGFKCSELFEEFPASLDGFVNTSLSLPYTLQTRMNGLTGEITYQDTAGNFGSIGFFPQISSVLLQLNPLALMRSDEAGYTGFESGAFGLNAGYALPVITPPIDFVSYCNFPPPLVCEPSVLSTIEFGEPQTVVINGQNVVATSLGNANVDGGIISSNTFQTGTKDVHIELTVELIVGSTCVFGLAFADDDTLIANLFAGVVYSREFGILLDIESSQIIGFPNVPDGTSFNYVLALWIDGNTGAARMSDNISLTQVSLATSALWDNSKTMYMGAPFDAGNIINDQLNVTFNFDGTPAFELNPPANKWCDPNP
jgi:hypothetical protein